MSVDGRLVRQDLHKEASVTTLSAVAVFIPKRSYDEWLARQPE